MNLFHLSKSVNTAIFLFITFICPISPAQAQMQQVAILPFTVNAEKDLTYIKEGISQMLSSRLAWKDKVLVIPPKTILNEVQKEPQLSGPPLVTSIFNHTDVHYVISGSITEFAGTFSLDTSVYTDTSGSPMHTFFGQANTPDDIIPEMSTIASKINQSVFNRNVTTLADSKGQQTTTKEDLTRANPEKLIPQVIQETPREQKPFWKFWKKEKPPAYPDETFSAMETAANQDINVGMDEDLSEEKIPFWKFWKKDNTDEIEDEEFDEEKAKKPFWKFWKKDNIDEIEDEEFDEEKAEKPFWKFW